MRPAPGARSPSPQAKRAKFSSNPELRRCSTPEAVEEAAEEDNIAMLEEEAVLGEAAFLAAEEDLHALAGEDQLKVDYVPYQRMRAFLNTALPNAKWTKEAILEIAKIATWWTEELVAQVAQEELWSVGDPRLASGRTLKLTRASALRFLERAREQHPWCIVAGQEEGWFGGGWDDWGRGAEERHEKPRSVAVRGTRKQDPNQPKLTTFFMRSAQEGL